jgi:hypothetical protein
MKRLWLECLKGLANPRLHGSKGSMGPIPHVPQGSRCGKAMLFPVKFHAPLQAAASRQAHSGNLRAYVQMGASERGESLLRMSRANVAYRLAKNNKQSKRWAK